MTVKDFTVVNDNKIVEIFLHRGRWNHLFHNQVKRQVQLLSGYRW